MRTVLLALAVLAAAPATATAATGTTTLDLGGRAFAALRSDGVRVVAKAPARLARRELRLPVRQGLVRTVALLNH
jgi:hypothetical protein